MDNNWLSLILMTPLIITSNEVVVLHPQDIATSVIGGHVEFTCFIFEQRNFDYLIWKLNGEELSAGQNHRDVLRMQYNQEERFGRLYISNLSLSYNDSAITCVAVQGSMLMESIPTRLLIQDNISGVFLTPLINNSTISLSWTRPNISSVITDITYCINIVAASTTTESRILSQCGITNTTVTYTLSPQDYNYDNITFSIIPTNNFINGSHVNYTYVIPDTAEGETIDQTSHAMVSATIPETSHGFSFSPRHILFFVPLQLLIIG